jgi:predicted regulator of Ras-like GTPase activity (Roadblock/LC7/MglB family)
MTRRSRSSFDLRDALDTAEALSPKAPVVDERIVELDGVPLVTFQGDRSSQLPRAPSTPAPALAIPASVPASIPATEKAPAQRATLGALAEPPQLAEVDGLSPRLDALLRWLRSDASVQRVLVVDADGLPIAGDVRDAEELSAATGAVTSAVRRVAEATPGALAGHFETCIGESPVLQLVGVALEGRALVVGITRSAPFAEADVRRIRTAFVAALGEP